MDTSRLSTAPLYDPALDWLAPALGDGLRQVRSALEAYHPERPGDLQPAIDRLHQLAGILTIAQWHGAALAMEELEATLAALADGATDDPDETMAALVRGLNVIDNYLHHLGEGHPDQPMALLPALNELRAVRGADLLSAGLLMRLDVDVATPPPPSALGDERPEALQAILRRLHLYYQSALLAWYRDPLDSRALGQLEAVLACLLDQPCGEPNRRLWWVAGGAVEALAQGTLERSQPVKRLLGQVERHLHALVRSNDPAFLAPPATLIKDLLYYIAQAAPASPRVQTLHEAYQLARAVPSPTYLSALSEAISTPEREAYAVLAQGLLEDLRILKARIEYDARHPDVLHHDLDDTVARLESLSDSLVLLGLGRQRELLNTALQALERAPRAALEDLALALMHVEHALQRLAEDQDREQAEAAPPREEYRQATHALVREAKATLGQIRNGILAYVTSERKERGLPEVPRLLRELRGAMIVLGHERLAHQIDALGRYLRYDLLEQDGPPKAIALDMLAEALVSLEYYLDALERGQSALSPFLNAIARCLAVLGHPVAPDLALRPQTIPTLDQPVAAAPSPPPNVVPLPVDEIDDEVVAIFVEEAREVAADLAQLRPELTRRRPDPPLLARIRHGFHTLKGSGRIAGALELGDYARAMEGLLSRLMNGATSWNTDCGALLAQAIDQLPALIDAFEQGHPPPPGAQRLMEAAQADPPHLPAPEDMASDEHAPSSDGEMAAASTPPEAPKAPAGKGPAAEATPGEAPIREDAAPSPNDGEAMPTPDEETQTSVVEETAAPPQSEAAAAPVPAEAPDTPPEPPRPRAEVAAIPTPPEAPKAPAGKGPAAEAPPDEAPIREDAAPSPNDGEATNTPTLDGETQASATEDAATHPQSEGATPPEAPETAPATEDANPPAPPSHAEGGTPAHPHRPTLIPLPGGAEAPAPAASQAALAERFATVGGAEALLEALEDLARKSRDDEHTAALAFALRARALLEEAATPELCDLLAREVPALLRHRAPDAEWARLDARLQALSRPNPPTPQLREDEDLDPALTAIFQEEALELLEQLEARIPHWNIGAPPPAEELHAVQRALHTFKGGARVAGLADLGETAHVLESVMERLAAGPHPWHADLAQAVREALDHLAANLDHLRTGRPLEDGDALRRTLQQRLAPPSEGTENDMSAASPAVPVEPPSEGETRSETLRIAADTLDELVNQAKEDGLLNIRISEQQALFKSHLDELGKTIERLRERLRALPLDGLLAGDERQAQSLLESLDDLGNLHAGLSQANQEATRLLGQQHTVQRRLQSGLVEARMVPFSRQLPRLQRLVRQVAKELGKQARIELVGASGKLDRATLERLIGPLEHLVRNALAHGIEPPEERLAHGKPAEGLIRIGFAREGEEQIITLSDDGRGIDPAQVLEAARRRGLPVPERLTPEGLLDLLAHPGFSTAERVDQVAGRGIGLDAVMAAVRELGGQLSLDSQPGRGTTFTLRIPFTLGMNRCVLVAAGDNVYALPAPQVRQVLMLSREELARLYQDPETPVQHQGRDYPFAVLADLLGLPEPRPASPAHLQPVLLVEHGPRRLALHADRLLGSRELILKSDSPPLAGQREGVLGATVLGDGRVVLVLDLAWLLERPRPRPKNPFQSPPRPAPEGPIRVLVVDDSITVRRVTERLLGRHGMEVRCARDGLEALERLEEALPDILLLDIEMPRMDGFELAERIRSHPRWRDLPIIMISSRSGHRQRQRARELGVDRFLGKPYQEAMLVAQIEALTQRAETVEEA